MTTRLLERLREWGRHELPLVRLHALRRLEESLDAVTPEEASKALDELRGRDGWSARMAERIRARLGPSEQSGEAAAEAARLLDGLRSQIVAQIDSVASESVEWSLLWEAASALGGPAVAECAARQERVTERVMDALEGNEAKLRSLLEGPLGPSALRKLGALDAVEEAAASPDAGMRAAAALACRQADALDVLLRLLGDRSPQVAHAAVRGIGALDDPRLAEKLRELARPGRPAVVRVDALRALGRLAPSEWLESPESLVGREAPACVLAAALEAAALALDDALEPYFNHVNLEVRAAANAASLPAREEEAVMQLGSLLGSARPQARRAAAARLGLAQEASLVERAVELLAREDDALVLAALMAGLQTVSPGCVAEHAPRLLADPRPHVRLWASDLTGMLRPEGAGPLERWRNGDTGAIGSVEALLAQPSGSPAWRDGARAARGIGESLRTLHQWPKLAASLGGALPEQTAEEPAPLRAADPETLARLDALDGQVAALAYLAEAARRWAERGELDTAGKAIELLGRLMPLGTGTHRAAGEFLFEHRRLEAAWQQLQLAHQAAPDDLRLAVELAVAGIQTGRYDSARALASAIVAGQPAESPWARKAQGLLDSLEKKVRSSGPTG